MKVEIIETFMVFGIVILQLYIFWQTRKKIKIFRDMIPDSSSLKVLKHEESSSKLMDNETDADEIKYKNNRASTVSKFVQKDGELQQIANQSRIPKIIIPKTEDNSNPELGFTYGNTLFGGLPNIDGSFNRTSIVPDRISGEAVFQFNKINDFKLGFIVNNDEASFQLAMRYPAKYLSPVCDFSNSFSPDASNILTIVPGELELIDDKWNITRKAKIRFLS